MYTLLKRLTFIVLPLSIIFIISCRKEMEKAHWDTQLLAPLINASMTINNVLPDSILQANADSSLKIVYQNDIFNLTLDTLLSIPDTSVKQYQWLPISSIVLSPGQVLFSNNISETTYGIKPVELRKIIIKSGFVTYTIKSEIKEVTDFTYSIPCAKLNGIPFSINVSVPAAVGNTPGVFSQVYDLSGYEFILTGKNNNKVNTFYTSFGVAISSLGSPVTVTNQDSLTIENTFSDIFPSYAQGYFGQTTINVGPEQTDFTMFNKIIGGTLELEDVDFNLNIENPIGIDTRILISNISSINTKKNTTVNLNSSIINAPQDIVRAAESSSASGIITPTYKNFPLNAANSNIKQLIENLPDKLAYTMKIETNPFGNTSYSKDFIYSDRLMKANLSMEVPLSFIAHDLTLADTLDFNISKDGPTENLNYGTLTLFANNGFPLDASIQMYLLNENNIILDSIFPATNTIYQAPVDAILKVTQKKLTKLVIPIDADKMNLLFDTKKMILKVKFNTASKPQYVKIYSHYSIDVKLVGDFNYTVYMQ